MPSHIACVKSTVPAVLVLLTLGACGASNTAGSDVSNTADAGSDAPISEPPETCNDLDDDDDGSIDEGCPCNAGASRSCYIGAPAQAGIGACTTGRQTCGPDGTWSTCEGSGLPAAETCNGLDDDCNGSVDEGCSCTAGTSRSCFGGTAAQVGVGACKAGTQHCLPEGKWDTCKGQVLPKPETCKGEDDDCDGVADEDCQCAPDAKEPCYSGPAGTKDIGTCRGGERSCIVKPTGGSAWSGCVGEVLPVPETNYVDDSDCTGANDYVCVYEGQHVAGKNTELSGFPQEDGVGAAARFGLILSMARDPSNGDLVVLDQRAPGYTYRVRRVSAAGLVTTVNQNDYPSIGGLTVTTDGTIWVAGVHELSRIPKTGAPSTMTYQNLGSGLRAVTAIASVGNELWVGHYDLNAAAPIAAVQRMNANGAGTGEAYTIPQMKMVQGLAVDPSGPIYANGHSQTGALVGVHRIPLPGSTTAEPLFAMWSRRLVTDGAGHLIGDYGVYSMTGRLLARSPHPPLTDATFLYGGAFIDGSTVWGAFNQSVVPAAQGYLSEVWRYSGCPLP